MANAAIYLRVRSKCTALGVSLKKALDITTTTSPLSSDRKLNVVSGKPNSDEGHDAWDRIYSLA
jgi:hypothetical protein